MVTLQCSKEWLYKNGQKLFEEQCNVLTAAFLVLMCIEKNESPHMALVKGQVKTSKKKLIQVILYAAEGSSVDPISGECCAFKNLDGFGQGKSSLPQFVFVYASVQAFQFRLGVRFGREPPQVLPAYCISPHQLVSVETKPCAVLREYVKYLGQVSYVLALILLSRRCPVEPHWRQLSELNGFLV